LTEIGISLETAGNQSLFNGTLTFENEEKGSFYYQFENLKLSDLYNGTRHHLGLLWILANGNGING
jgi:hypothetical protein